MNASDADVAFIRKYSETRVAEVAPELEDIISPILLIFFNKIEH